MNKRRILGSTFGLFWLFMISCQAQQIGGEDSILACVYDRKKPMTSGQAKIHFKNGMIERILFNNYYPGGHGRLSFTCHIDLYRDDPAYFWQENDAAILIASREKGDSLLLRRNRKGYMIDFANIKSPGNYCGAGAKLPRDLVVPFAGKSCQVRLPR